MLTVGCDGTYWLVLNPQAVKPMTCDGGELAVRLEERKAHGATYVHGGSLRLSPRARYVSIRSWPTGGAPEAFRLSISCTTTQQVVYDSGLRSSDRIHRCSTFNIVTLLEPDAETNEHQLCEWLQAGADKDVVSEVEFRAPRP